MTTGISKQSVYRRVRETRAYHDERLKLLFGIIYRDPVKALEKWKARVSGSGFEIAFKKQRRKTRILGKLSGIGFLGLYQSRDRQKTDHANAEFHQMARSWYRAVIEEEEADRLEKLQIQEATQPVDTQKDQRAYTSAKAELDSKRTSGSSTDNQSGAKL